MTESSEHVPEVIPGIAVLPGRAALMLNARATLAVSKSNEATQPTSEISARGAASSPRSQSSTRTRLWDIIADEVSRCGVCLFDLEVPTGMKGAVRVFISKPKSTRSEQSVPLQENNLDDAHVRQTSEFAAENQDLVEGEGSSPSNPEIPLSPTTSELETTPAIAQRGISLEDCARVSKHLELFMDSPAGVELGLSTEQWDLEVSSPGINRILKRPEHFDDAVGERVTLRFAPESATFSLPPPAELAAKTIGGGKRRKKKSPPEERAKSEIERIQRKKIASGILQECSSESLVLTVDEGILVIEIPRDAVSHAKVDFLFEHH